MISAMELHRALDRAIPRSLSAEWDNDGLMCCPSPEKSVNRVLVTLDITERVIEHAIHGGFDVILSHHPLVFRPVKAIDPQNAVPRKLITLIRNNICAMSFHTRFDALSGGVNDALADALGLQDAKPFGGEGEQPMGRIGDVTPCTLAEFSEQVKNTLKTPFVLCSGELPVRRVAVLGGGGEDFIAAAKAAGADTYLSGRLGYHQMSEAKEIGINLIEAGHYYTENVALPRLASLVKDADSDIITEIMDSIEISAI